MVKEVKFYWEAGHPWDLPGYRDQFDDDGDEDPADIPLPRNAKKTTSKIKNRKTNPHPQKSSPESPLKNPRDDRRHLAGGNWMGESRGSVDRSFREQPSSNQERISNEPG